MALKIYTKGSLTLVDDGNEIISSGFSFSIIGDDITILDNENNNNVWNVVYSSIQNEAGSQAGATLELTTTYLGDNLGQSVTVSSDAEVTAFVTTALLADAATFDSGVLDVSGKTQVQTEINASHDGTIDISFCSDSGGLDVVRSLSIPYVAADGYQFFAAPAFVNFIKYEFTNDGGVTQTDFYYTTKLLTTALSPQLLTTGAFIASGMVATLNRNIIVGEDVNGVFNNASVLATTNDAGTTHNLQVVSGARPSQLAGRTSVKIVADTTAPSLEYTVTSGKTFFVTDILLTIDNSDQTSTGRLDIYDSLVSPTTEPLILPINIEESTAQETTVTTISHSFTEPIEFDAGVWFEEASGTLTMTGIINGYEE